MRNGTIRLLVLGLIILAGLVLFVWLSPRTEPPVVPARETVP
jgi:hypothetical protein